ncbi:MAG: hypothetical protein AAGC56_10640, partial [Pseudomonadota bacterium]
MGRILLAATAVALMAGPAVAQTRCTKGGAVRVATVATPGVVGKACDLVVSMGTDGPTRTPYHANFDAGYCAQKAVEIVTEWRDEGFVCADGVAADAAPTASIDPSAPPATPVAPQSAPEETGDDADDQDGVEPAAAASATVSEPNKRSATILREEAGLAPRAEGEPLSLVSASATAPAGSRTPRTSAVGRLVGAAPSDAAVAEQTSAKTAANPIPVLRDARAPRPAPEVIRQVLKAQAAAWNDGDIAGFMEGYWKSPRLRFVSGQTVTRGWESTLNRYRERYGDGDALGQLDFDDLDVTMIS